jgi:hypothetical protein
MASALLDETIVNGMSTVSCEVSLLSSISLDSVYNLNRNIVTGIHITPRGLLLLPGMCLKSICSLG